MAEENAKVRRKDNEDDDGYDPHDYREVAHPTTNFETTVHILKGSLGTGILAMPEAFKNAGYVLGSVCTLILGSLVIYSLLILIASQYILCKRYKLPFLTYPRSMQLALNQGPKCLKFLSNASLYIVDGFLIVNQMGVCVIYILFVAENLKQFFDMYVGVLEIKLYICILFFPLLLIQMIPNLKLLAPLVIVANILTFIGFGIILYFVFQDLPSLSDRNMVAPSVKTLPLFFGTVIFSLEAVGVIIALENNMKTPKSFNAVLPGSLIFIVFMYGFLGFTGYWKYGDDTTGSVTLSLPKDELLAQSVRIMFALAILISYALQGYVPVDIVWNQHLKLRCKDSKYVVLYEYLIRLANVVITCLVAIAIPKFGLFISLVGALCLSTLGFIFPAILDLCSHWPDNLGWRRYILYKDIFIVFFGLFVLVCGTYVAIHDIIESYH